MTCACGAGHDHSVAPSMYETLDQANDRVGCLMMTPEFWDERARFQESCAEHYGDHPALEVHAKRAAEKAKRYRARAEACRLKGAA